MCPVANRVCGLKTEIIMSLCIFDRCIHNLIILEVDNIVSSWALGAPAWSCFLYTGLLQMGVQVDSSGKLTIQNAEMREYIYISSSSS